MNYLKRAVVASLLAAAMLIAACTSIPLTSLPKLARLDMETVDPGRIEIAVRLPKQLDIPPGGVQVSLEFKNKTTGEELGGGFPLVPLDEPLTPFLQRKATKDRTVARFRLDEEQAEAIRDVRRAAFAQRDTCDGNCSISFAVETMPCVKAIGNPFRSLTFSVYLKTEEDGDFFTFINNKSARLDDELGEAVGGLKLCDALAAETED